MEIALLALGAGSIETGSIEKGALRQAAGAHSHWSRGAGTAVEVERSPADETVMDGLADGDAGGCRRPSSAQ